MPAEPRPRRGRRDARCRGGRRDGGRHAPPPSIVTGYVREAFVGRDEESGLRVTIDSRIRGRDRDSRPRVEGDNRLIVRPDLAIVEVKVNERVPTWLTDRVARHDMQVIRISKYCQGVEAFGRAPRSLFHAPEPVLQGALMFDSLFDGFEDLTGTFTVADVVLSMVASFVLCAVIGWVYKRTHRGISYSQSYVQTFVMMGMVVSLIMLVVGSNLARAFALVGALSIVRFRNAIKETRDVGFIFFALGIGMATGTRFYTLAAVATAVICAVVVIMERFDWYRLDIASQIVKAQVPAGQRLHADDRGRPGAVHHARAARQPRDAPRRRADRADLQREAPGRRARLRGGRRAAEADRTARR